MFGSLGGSELLLILVLALLLFGPRRLPQIGRTIGRAMSEFRKATNELKTNLEREVRTDELGEFRSGIDSLNRDLKETVDSVNPRRVVERAIGRVKDPDLAKPTKPEPAPPRPAPSAGAAPATGAVNDAEASSAEAPSPESVESEASTSSAPSPDEPQRTDS